MVSVSTLADSCSSKAATDPSSTGMHLRKVTTRILVDFLHRRTRFLIECNLRVGRMSKKSLLTISSLLFLAAIPAMAHAGATISDKRYWPSEARSGGYVLGGANSVTNSALGWDTMAHVQSAGKPKAFLRHYRRGSAAR